MLLDTTLREGEQAFGVYMDIAAKRYIVETLARAGIEELEIGYVGQECLPALLEHARRVAPHMAVSVWCRCREADVRAAAELGVRRINMGVPVSHAHITERLRTTEAALRDQLAAVISLARSRGISFISLGLEDCSRAEIDDAVRMAGFGVGLGAARIRLSDTVGLLTPVSTAQLVTRFRASLPRETRIGTHFHNDFGMATANAITALVYGADCADVSVLGIGERAGIARLEEVAAACLLRLAGESHFRAYDLPLLRALAEDIAELAHVVIPRNRPILGQDIFAVESGLHTDGLQKQPSLFEPFDPALVDGRRLVGLGRKSGRAAVVGAARDAGFELEQEAADMLVKRVRDVADRLNRTLHDEEFRELCHECAGASPPRSSSGNM